MPDSPEGRLIVISGPSGVGKTSIVEAVLARTNARFSVSATTREPRPGEVQGVDYTFLTPAAFRAMRDRGDILEWATYGGHFYGTPRAAVLPIIETGTDVVLDIENEGARQIRDAYPDALMIFIRPPTLHHLAERLARRGDTSPSDIDKRLAVADEQIVEAGALYDHIVTNDDLATTITEVLDILRQPRRTP
ncbi:MAG: guanylate kinase [Acidimicrobiia bacterium]